MTQSVLVTGANRGIGLAFVEHYLECGWEVYATYRTKESAQALLVLQEQYEKTLQLEQLDITDFSAITQLSQKLNGKALDLVISNAGQYGPKGYGFGNVDVEAWKSVMETNVYAPLKLAEALKANLMRAHSPIFAALSSKVGSHTENTKGGGYIYRSSKAALNSVIKSLSNDLLPEGIKTVSLHPGWVQTEMGGPNALISTDIAVKGMKTVIDNLTESQSGGFYNYQGEQLPW